jgi:hypothetical protein
VGCQVRGTALTADDLQNDKGPSLSFSKDGQRAVIQVPPRDVIRMSHNPTIAEKEPVFFKRLRVSRCHL